MTEESGSPAEERNGRGRRRWKTCCRHQEALHALGRKSSRLGGNDNTPGAGFQSSWTTRYKETGDGWDESKRRTTLIGKLSSQNPRGSEDYITGEDQYEIRTGQGRGGRCWASEGRRPTANTLSLQWSYLGCIPISLNLKFSSRTIASASGASK